MNGIYKLIIVLMLLLLVSKLTFAQSKTLTIKDIYTNPDLKAKVLEQVKWFADGEKFSFVKYDKANEEHILYEHEVNTGNENKILSSSDIKINGERTLSVNNYIWSPDEKYLLFTDALSARSMKSGGVFYLYSLSEKKVTLVIESEKEQLNVQFSPDSKKLGFVRNNNLFVADIETGQETQLTFDGSNVILNGCFDWVYEEEFSIIEAWEWSPDGKSIAFWRLDQSQVPLIKIAKWDSLHLNTLDMRYPKAGDKISEVQIGVVDIEKGKTTWMNLGDDKNLYIPRISFTTDPELLSVQKLNRLQNNLELLFYDIKTGNSRHVLEENDSCWVDVFDDLYFLKDGKHFIWSSEREGYHHLYLYDYDGNIISKITKGNWEIKELVNVDESNQTIFYTSNERGRLYSDLYSVNFDGSNKKRLTEYTGSHSINMSPDCQFFIDKYSNANTFPATSLVNLNKGETRFIITPDMNSYNEYKLGRKEFFQITTPDNYNLDASIIKPSDMNSDQKYPVLIIGYNGPGSQDIEDSWKSGSLWEKYLVQEGFIVIAVDCRITGGNGTDYKKLAYKNLGYWEVNDMIETVKYLRKLPYVDTEKIGIFGWSYGGYISSLTILKAADYFNTAIAVAPVTNYKFYDAIYTERYMSLPGLNPDGYENGSTLNYADKLRGKFLLIHGMADDNVHVQNSIKLAEKLIENNKQFEVMFYPEKDHGIDARIHLFELMTNFLMKNLKDDFKKSDS